MPVPMMAPMPSAVRFQGPSARLRLWSDCGFGLQVGDALAAEEIHGAQVVGESQEPSAVSRQPKPALGYWLADG